MQSFVHDLSLIKMIQYVTKPSTLNQNKSDQSSCIHVLVAVNGLFDLSLSALSVLAILQLPNKLSLLYVSNNLLHIVKVSLPLKKFSAYQKYRNLEKVLKVPKK